MPQRIVLAVGLPGSGKSTYFEKRGVTPLSSDWLRQLLADDPAEQGFQKGIFMAMRFLLRLRIRMGLPVSCIDATNLTRAERRRFIQIARQHGCEAEAIFFQVPLEICQRRNRSRGRTVPEEAMLRLAARLSPPELEEGFRKITVIDARGRRHIQLA